MRNKINGYGQKNTIIWCLKGHKNRTQFKKTKSLWSFCIVLALIFCRINLGMVQAESKSNREVDYVAKIKKLAEKNRGKNLNGSSYYKKAFKLSLDLPEQISLSELKCWPKDLSADKQILLESWVSSNNRALEQLKLGSQKSYCWFDYQGSSIRNITFPDLKKARALCYLVCMRAKLNAANGQLEKAFSDLLVCYRFGRHLMGPKVLIEQLVGIGIISNANQASLEVLKRAELTSGILKDFQQELESIRSERIFIDFTAEKFFLYENTQIMFTDDGKGGGRIKQAEVEAIARTYKQQEQMSSQEVEKLKLRWNNLEKRQTIELADKVYEYYNRIVRKTPYQMRSEGKPFEKAMAEVTRNNALLEMLAPNSRVIEMFFRCEAESDALITILAISRYKADNGKLPQKVNELVSTGYLKSLPMDPYSNKPLVYKKAKDDFMLYSLGADFDDDGGMSSKWGEGEQGGDQVFWPIEHSDI
jgi:hypothetical protein